MISYHLTHLEQLEHEAIYVLRETVAQFDHPALLFSGGKDSTVLLRLAEKAFRPARFPFPLLHIDTGHNFPETIKFRDEIVRTHGYPLIVRLVADSILQSRVQDERGRHASRNALQTVTLLDAIQELGFDACIGGGRRDEDKARAKERFFSHRNEFGQWDPKNQRPELWRLFNGRRHHGEHFRVFPLSNWTELDIWHYIAREQIVLPPLYFSHMREVVLRDGLLIAASPNLPLRSNELPESRRVRFRTVGDMTCTGAIESTAVSLSEIIAEVAASRITERGSRFDDRRSESAMEDRKKAGYF